MPSLSTAVSEGHDKSLQILFAVYQLRDVKSSVVDKPSALQDMETIIDENMDSTLLLRSLLSLSTKLRKPSFDEPRALELIPQNCSKRKRVDIRKKSRNPCTQC